MGLGAARNTLLATLVALPALAADPYPNQPGALTAEQLKSAAAALSPAEKDLPLTASGHREGHLPYAVFAAPAKRESKEMTRQARVRCFALPPSQQWSCTKQTLYEVTHGGKREVFAYSVIGGEEDPQAAARLLRYFAGCFGAQYQALAGKPFPGEVPPLEEVEQQGEHLAVTAGQAVFQLQSESAPSSPSCAFSLTLTRGSAGSFIAQSVRVQAPVQVQRPFQPQTPPPAVPGESASRDVLNGVADMSVKFIVDSWTVAIVFPLLALLAARQYLIIASLVVPAAAVVCYIALVVALWLRGTPGDISYTIPIILPFVVFAGLIGVAWVIIAMLFMRKRAAPP